MRPDRSPKENGCQTSSVPSSGERVAMMLLGHATRCIFDRYNIVNERDVCEGGRSLAAAHCQVDEDRA
jgi:hypothetical protein